MKTIEKLKDSTEKLEQEISTMIDSFLEENGDCLIEINTNMSFSRSQNGEPILIDKNVKVKITI